MTRRRVRGCRGRARAARSVRLAWGAPFGRAGVGSGESGPAPFRRSPAAVFSSIAGTAGGGEAELDGVEGGLGTAVHAQLGEDAADVGLDGLLADVQLASD